MVRWGVVLLFSASSAWGAQACLNAPLSWYLALGPSGCTIDPGSPIFTTPVSFRGFTYSGDPTAITAQDFDVPFWPGMIFSGFTGPLDTYLTYEIDAPATRSEPYCCGQIGPIQPIQVTDTLCLGAAFAADGTCSTQTASSGDYFALTSVIGIREHIQMDAAGPARFGSGISQPGDYGNCECGIPGGFTGGDPAVPEPASWELLAGALALLALRTVRQ